MGRDVWRRGFAAALGLLLTFAAGCAGNRAVLAGRVMYRGEPLAGATVRADPETRERAEEVVTDTDGMYRLPDLEPGSYRLSAAVPGTPDLGAISGKNPLQLVAGKDQWVGLQAVPRESPRWQAAPHAPEGFGDLGGTLRRDGAPVADAVVDLYLDRAELRGPGFRQSFPTGPDGGYALDEVPEGRYYLVARRRVSGATAGPVVEGDLYGEALANPVEVRSRQETRLDIHLVRKERSDDPNTDLLATDGAALRGVVLDTAGAPVPGVYVFAYRNRVVGHGMPDYRTLPTGPDGSFALSVGDGGLFYVGAREHAGGSPLPGEWFGFYEGSADHGLTVPAGGQVKGVRVIVRRVLGP